MSRTKRIALNDRTSENDIKFKGVLSYRHLRIIAWVCLIIAQISTILTINSKINQEFGQSIEWLQEAFSYISVLPVPLFMLANFSHIMRNKYNYRSLFILYGGGALGLYLLANFVVFHYGFRTMNAFVNNYTWWDTSMLFGKILVGLGKRGYTLNIFIDMLLCTLLFFFMNYEPKKSFKGKWIILFRLMVILPIIYEVASIFIKYFITNETFDIPSFAFFLLPSKPPLIFLAFVIIVFALKIGEITYKRRHNNSEELYKEHTSTNAHSLKTSIIISITFTVLAIVDFVILIISLANIETLADLYEKTTDMNALVQIKNITAFLMTGFGSSIFLILIVPLVMLFSYTKTHKNPKIDTFIPIVAVGLIVIIYIEGLFQIFINNTPKLIEKIKEIIDNYFGGGGEEEAPQEGASIISNIFDIIKPK